MTYDTLNEARDALVKEFPGRTIHIVATSEHNPNLRVHRLTEFSAYVWECGGGGIEFSCDDDNLDSVVEATRQGLLSRATVDADNPAKATAEPEEDE